MSEAATAATVRVRVGGKGETSADFACRPGETILHAGLRAGVALAYECATGTCGTCKATLVSGETVCDWPEAPGHKTVKAERRELLMCQNRPLDDVSLTVARRLDLPVDRIAPDFTGGFIDGSRTVADGVLAFTIVLDTTMSFRAGQFALVSVDGVPGARAYSMTNFAAETARLELLVKRSGGGFTGWLFEKPRDGARVRVFGPVGAAVFEPELGHELCLMAGGSGIAGMMAMLEHACGIGYFREHAGEVVFGVRTANDVFFLDELAAYASAAGGRLRVTIALSHDDASPELRARYPDLDFATGFVHDAARSKAIALENAMYFIAGPPPMVDASLRMLLLEAKAPANRIRYDKFG